MDKKKKAKKSMSEADVINTMCMFMLDECVANFRVFESEFEYQKIWVRKLKEREPFKFQFISHKQWQKDFDLAVEHLALLKNIASKKRALVNNFTKKLGGHYGHKN